MQLDTSYLVATTDITERNRAEEALRESEERFSKAFYSSPSAMVITRLADGCYLEVNDKFTKLTGYTREEAIGHTTVELGVWPSLQARTRAIQKLQKQGEIRDIELNLGTKSARCEPQRYQWRKLTFVASHVYSV